DSRNAAGAGAERGVRAGFWGFVTGVYAQLPRRGVQQPARCAKRVAPAGSAAFPRGRHRDSVPNADLVPAGAASSIARKHMASSYECLTLPALLRASQRSRAQGAPRKGAFAASRIGLAGLLAAAALALSACAGGYKPPAPPATSKSPVSAPPTERVVGPLSEADA